MSALFADIILPFALEKNYTYSVPDDMQAVVKPGIRVEVPFRNKTYSGIVARVHTNKPVGYETKPVLSLPDHLQVVNKIQLDFWQWMADYYMCSTGDVMNAALPAPYKLSSETIIVLQDETKIDSAQLDDKEFLVAEALTIQKELSLNEIQKILHQKTIQPVIKSLIQKGIVFVKEELKETFKPKKEKFILLNPHYAGEEALQILFGKLEKFPKQLNILMMYYQLAQAEGKIKKAVLLRKSNATPAVLATMLKNNIFIETDEEVSRLKLQNMQDDTENLLTHIQQQALKEIHKNLEEKNVVLLHGVTGSGKTEIYIELIKQIISANQQVLYLLPEIALTAQIINRLKKRFGSSVGVYHSKFNQQERIEIWQRVLSGEFKIILGARSALFLPFINLGLIIVDEEHDTSFKQFEPNPRYHARDAAIYLANLFKAKTILGTATPSIESYYNAKTGKYGLIKLHERYAGMQMPDIKIIDLRQEIKSLPFPKKDTSRMHFSKHLLAEITNSLEKKEQVILFQNRRGYAPYIMCEACGWVPSCINCDVHLVYHKYADELRCHYCGYHQKTFSACPACASTRILIQGLGTEKIEDELQQLFPENKIARLDLDAVKTKYGHEKIIQDFEAGEIDILVGTQMVTKGLDFDQVNLVGIISADSILNYSDFRAGERAYQMITQVSGRAGRKNKKGLVLIQAFNINHPVLQYILLHDYDTFFESELQQRKEFKYPPFSRLIRITLRHSERELVYKAAHHLAQQLKQKLNQQILGPVSPAISRIKNKFLQEILIKAENNSVVLSKIKSILKHVYAEIENDKRYKKTDIISDVDPL